MTFQVTVRFGLGFYEFLVATILNFLCYLYYDRLIGTVNVFFGTHFELEF